MLKYKIILVLLTIFLNKNLYTCEETAYIMKLPSEIQRIISLFIIYQEDANQIIKDLKNLSKTSSHFYKLINNHLFFKNIINTWIINGNDIEILLVALSLWPNKKVITKALNESNLISKELFESMYKSAILKCNIETIKAFLKLGADPNIKVSYSISEIKLTEPAVIFAVNIANYELTKVLYDFGADINVLNKYKHLISSLIVNA